MIGLFIGDAYENPTFITFGGYEDDLMSSEISWNPLVETYSWWQVDLLSSKFGSTAFQNTTLSKYAIIDSGAPYINIP